MILKTNKKNIPLNTLNSFNFENCFDYYFKIKIKKIPQIHPRDCQKEIILFSNY